MVKFTVRNFPKLVFAQCGVKLKDTLTRDELKEKVEASPKWKQLQKDSRSFLRSVLVYITYVFFLFSRGAIFRQENQERLLQVGPGLQKGATHSTQVQFDLYMRVNVLRLFEGPKY